MKDDYTRMTNDEKKMVTERLNAVWGEEVQEVTARKLNSSQSNISKYRNGQQFPPMEILFEISKAYRVSVDWLLGLSDTKDVDGIDARKLTYEQAFRILDRLLVYCNLISPNLSDIGIEQGSIDDELPDERIPVYDPDYLKINDRLLSFLFRRREKLSEVDMLDFWMREKLPNFKHLPMMDNTGNMEAALDRHEWAGFKEGDWIETIEKLSKMTAEEREKFIQERKSKTEEEV